jgi:hypothetical protein
VASILMTCLVHGSEGLREMLTRMTRWRVGARWYAVALLTAPLLSVAVLLTLSLISPEYLPTILITSDKVSLLRFIVVYQYENMGSKCCVIGRPRSLIKASRTPGD